MNPDQYFREEAVAQIRREGDLKDRIASLEAERDRLRALLKRLSEWDMLYVPPDYPTTPAVTSDGPYWQKEIRAALTDGQEP